MYAYVENGEIKRQGFLPKTWKLKDGATVSGFHLLEPEIHKQEGWLPIEEVKPPFNQGTQFLTNPAYEISGDKVVKTYSISEIPPKEPTEKEQIEDLKQSIAELSYLMSLGGDAS